MLAAKREVFVGIVLYSLPERIGIVDILVNRLENALYSAGGEGVGSSRVAVGSFICKYKVCQVVIARVVFGFYPFHLAAVFFLEGEIAGVDDFVFGIVVEVVLPRKPLYRCAGRGAGFGVGKLYACRSKDGFGVLGR